MNGSLKSGNFDLLLQAIRLDSLPTEIQKAKSIIETNEIDWDDLFIRADFHCIKPQLGNLLNKIHSHLVPVEIREKLKEANLDNLYRQMRNLAEFIQVKQLLHEAGIEVVPFKGFWLAHAFYGNLADRESVDIDVMIHIKDLERIKAIMAARGYVPEAAVKQLTNDYVMNELCEYNFDQYDGNTRIFHFEFHWRISLTVYAMDIKLEDLKSQIIHGSIQNKQLQAFTPSANLLLTVMHHGGKDQFLQLKQTMDIAAILNKHTDIDWVWLINVAKRFQVENLVYIAVRLAWQLSGVGIPPEIKEQVNSKFIHNLARNRVKMMGKPTAYWKTWQHNLQGSYFQILSRNSIKLKSRLMLYEIRKGILPQLIPKKFHPYFFNKKIRVKPVS